VLGEAGGTAVIVPGGGPFADQVRATQRRSRFDDAAAHHMALLAMEQYGRMLAGLHAALRPAASLREITRARRAGAVAVWMPTRMVLDAPQIPASWDITSDSLAAWLAGRLAADRLVLVKSVALADAAAMATTLSRRGVVDRAFPGYMAHSAHEVWCIDDSRSADLARALRTGRGPGTRILPPSTTRRRAPIASRRRHANIPG